MKADSIIIDRIRDSAEKIIRHIQGKSLEEFKADECVSAATILWLLQIGELAKHLGSKTKEMYVLPWKDIAGFRDMAVHEYFELSLPDIFLTATKDIPELLHELSRQR